MKKFMFPLAVVLAAAIGVVFIFYNPHPTIMQPEPTVIKKVEPPPPIRFPVVSTLPPSEEPEPQINEEQPEATKPEAQIADPAMRQLAELLTGQDTLIKLFYLDHFIERFVVTVDNLPHRSLALRQMPVKPAAGPFVIQTSGGDLVIDSDNSQRYSPYINLLEALNTQKLIELYTSLYPHFQKAYVNLGYPHGYFNDRLVDVIDHLLATPEIQEPIRVELFKNRYRFVDPGVETRSAGQKILLRIGSENAKTVKNKLRELREELTKSKQQ